MRDDEQRAGPAVEQVLQRGQRVGVEVVGRLVEEQHVRLVHEQPQQLQPAPLAAGQVAHRRPQPVAGRSRATRAAGAAVTSPVADAHRAANRLDGLQHPQVGELVELVHLLGEHGGADRRAPPRPTRRSARTSPMTSRSSVVLPEPLTPTMPIRSPGAEPPGDVVEQLAPPLRSGPRPTT